MRLRIERPAPDAIDPEKAFGVLFGSLLLAACVAVLALPPAALPRCVLYESTGIPCPSCGLTRAVRLLADGQFRSAFAAQPLGALAALALWVWVAYSWIVVVGRLPRVRLTIARREWRWIIAAAALAVIANWYYVWVQPR